MSSCCDIVNVRAQPRLWPRNSFPFLRPHKLYFRCSVAGRSLYPLFLQKVWHFAWWQNIYDYALTLHTPYSPPPPLQGRKGSQTNKRNAFVGFPAERVRAVCCGWRSLRPVWRPTATAGGRAPDIGRYESHKIIDILSFSNSNSRGTRTGYWTVWKGTKVMDFFILFSSHTGKEGITFCRKKSLGFLLWITKKYIFYTNTMYILTSHRVLQTSKLRVKYQFHFSWTFVRETEMFLRDVSCSAFS